METTQVPAEQVEVPAAWVSLRARLARTRAALGAVVVAGDARDHVPDAIAQRLFGAGWTTLRLDPLTPTERGQGEAAFDVGLMAERLRWAAWWLARRPGAPRRDVVVLGTGVEAAASLVAAADLGPTVRAVISAGGRPDLAGDAYLERVLVPCLLLVGSREAGLVRLHRDAARRLPSSDVRLVPAARLRDQPEVAGDAAVEWLARAPEGCSPGVGEATHL